MHYFQPKDIDIDSISYNYIKLAERHFQKKNPSENDDEWIASEDLKAFMYVLPHVEVIYYNYLHYDNNRDVWESSSWWE